MFFDILTESTPTKIGLFWDMGVTISENSGIGSEEAFGENTLDEISVDIVVCSWVVVLVVVVVVVVDVVVVVVVDVVVVVVVVVVVEVVVCSVVVVVGTVVVGFDVNISGSAVVNFFAIAMKDGKSSNNEVIVVADS